MSLFKKYIPAKPANHAKEEVGLTEMASLAPPFYSAEHSSELHWRSEPRAWIQDGELRTTGVFDCLAVEIVRLTVDDLALQHQLLAEHCPPSSDIK